MDAYTQKKLLWRIVVAFVLINLSWFIVTAAIDIGVIIGDSIQNIILAPFGDIKPKIVVNNTINLTFMATLIGGAVFVKFIKGIPQVGRYLIFLLISVLGTILAALVATIVFIMVRQVLLIVLTVLAPVAIALWVLPATSKYFDMWRNTLTLLILFYPFFKMISTCFLLLSAILTDIGK